MGELVYMAALRDRVARHTGVLHRLNVGDSYRLPPECARVATLAASDGSRHMYNYSHTDGVPELLDAISAYLREVSGMPVERSDVQVTASGTTGVNVVMQALVDPGDEVLLLSPYWPLMPGAIKMRGATVVEVPCMHVDDAELLRSLLEARVTERTVACYVNPVCNPTGRILSDTMADTLEEFACAHNLWIIVDDAYAELYFTETAPARLWARPRVFERAVVFNTFSKMFAFCGARVGFVHGPRFAMSRVRGLQTYASFCAAHPMQVAVLRCLTLARDFPAELRAAYGAAARELAAALRLPAPDGGCFMFVDLAPFKRDGESFEELLGRCVDAGVLVSPGSICGKDFATWARICFTSVDPPALRDAAARLASVLHEAP